MGKSVLFLSVLSYVLAMAPDRTTKAATAGAASRALSRLQVFARLDDGQWHVVLRQSAEGCEVAVQGVDFESIWAGEAGPATTPATRHVAWSELKMPLPREDIPCWAYALTYPDHRREAQLSRSFRFPKGGPAAPYDGVMAYREHLDYEGEILLLLNARFPDRFGFLMGNDWTDRGIQVREFDLDNQVDVFAKAKHFSGSLRVGPLLAIGDADAWSGLGLEVYRNGRLRQSVQAVHCAIDPEYIREDLSGELATHDLALAMTGTAGGTIFRTPSSWQRLGLWFGNGFSVARGKEAWLRRLDFLRSGDEVVMRSPILGEARMVIGDHPARRTSKG